MKKVIPIFTELEQKFLDTWTGHPHGTATKAGISDRDLEKILKNPDVADAIRDKELPDRHRPVPAKVLTTEELCVFWSNVTNGVMVDSEGRPVALSPDTRMKASENLAKSRGAFSERHIHEGTLTNVNVGVDARDVDERVQALLGRKLRKELRPQQPLPVAYLE